MGAIVRIGAAFGIDALLLGKGCCDPFARRVIRVSMGTTFTLPIVESQDLASDLLKLKTEWGFQLAATVLDDDSEELDQAKRSGRFGILMGNEDVGLDDSWTGLCEKKLTIPMCRGTDSLNVAVAAGIVLHHLTRESSYAH
jgi:tRNA G18 (ribose-2'-O)-methylase SpoU